MPKSSSANLQPSSFSAWMKRLACEKLATAAVSVISKQIFEASSPLRWNCSMTNGRNLSSPRLWPERLIEHMSSFSRSSASETSQRNAFSITQRSIAGVMP